MHNITSYADVSYINSADRLTVILEYINIYAQWQNTMSSWVRLPPTAALIAFGVIIII